MSSGTTSLFNKLDVIQNRALRVAIGTIETTSFNVLLAESGKHPPLSQKEDSGHKIYIEIVSRLRDQSKENPFRIGYIP